MPQRFATTRWSLVLAAQGQNELAQRALSELCALYWYPVYAFVRYYRGCHDEAARELTQGFFVWLLEHGVSRVDPERGRFRSWLLGASKHYLANDRKHWRAKKRCAPLVWLDDEDTESRYARDAFAGQLDAEQLYARIWTRTLLGRTLARLADTPSAKNHPERFERMRPLLVGPDLDAPDYALLAELLGVSVGALRTYACQLRSRFRELFREEVAALVDGTPEGPEVDAEIRCLLQALGARG